MTEKTFEELTPEELKNLKIEFAPGCFDSFEGSQEELDGLIATIKEMFASGEALEKAIPIDFDSMDEEDIEMFERLTQQEEQNQKRTLQ